MRNVKFPGRFGQVAPRRPGGYLPKLPGLAGECTAPARARCPSAQVKPLLDPVG